MSDYINIKDQDYSFWGQGSKIKGEFQLKGPSRLASSIEGELLMIDNSSLCIESEGHFSGNIKCHNMDIYGRVDGIILSTGKVTVYPTAQLNGTIKAQNLVIYPGACINIEGHTS